MFEISHKDKTVKIQGRFNASMVDKAKEIFDNVNETVYVDCEGLNYFSSAGLSVLLKTQKRLMKQNQELIMKNMNDFNCEIFRLAGFDSIFKILE
jgi:anti-anti-sigma factor